MTNHCCINLRRFVEDEFVGIVYNSKFREYGILYIDGSSSYQTIINCPWCGTRLPESLRDEWFDQLDNMGIEPDSPELPEQYKSDSWWKNRQ